MSEGNLLKSLELGLEESDVTETCSVIFEDSMFKHHKPADSASSVCGVRVYMSHLVLLSVSRSQALAGRLLPGNKPFCWSFCSWMLYVLYMRLNNLILYIFFLNQT